MNAFKTLNTARAFGLLLCAVVGVGVVQPTHSLATHSPENEAAAAENERSAMTLDSLLSAFSEMEGLEARFVEQKQIAMLAAPLESRGTIYFAKPGYLLRRIEEPRSGEVLVTPERLVVSEGGEVQQVFDLNAREDVARFVESFVWILSGNQAALTRDYEVRFEAREAEESDAWRMTLIPNNERLGHIIRQIVVEGTELEVEQITVQESSGDETITTIIDADPARTFSDVELRDLFGQLAE